MHPLEKAVRDAAAALHAAILEAEAIGFRVIFPTHQLPGIAVSETAKFVNVFAAAEDEVVTIVETVAAETKTAIRKIIKTDPDPAATGD